MVAAEISRGGVGETGVVAWLNAKEKMSAAVRVLSRNGRKNFVASVNIRSDDHANFIHK